MRCVASLPMTALSVCCAPRPCTPCRDPWPSSSNYRKLEMSQPVKMSFERQVVVLPLSDILPVKRVPDSTEQTSRYKRIVVVVLEEGMGETLVVARPRWETGPYMLVDGHL